MIDEQGQNRPGPLEFKPDERRLVKLVRLRRLVLLMTMLILVGALLWLLFFPVRVSVVKDVASTQDEVIPVERQDDEAKGSGYALPKAEPVEERVLIEAAQLVAVIDSGVKAALVGWDRAEALVSGESVREDNLDEMLARIGMARAMSESARAIVDLCQKQLRRLQGMLSHSGIVGLRIGSAYSAARDYLELVIEEAGDRKSWLDFYELAVRALTEKDRSEFDIKMNVAGGYRRSFEVRQRRLKKAGLKLESVQRGLLERG
ncbi:MAG: hypothetical protein ACUVUR_05650 [bacterium]